MAKQKVQVFNYGAYSARDYWNLVAKPDLQSFNDLRSPISVAHVVQSLWGLLEWYAQEQGSKAEAYFRYFPSWNGSGTSPFQQSIAPLDVHLRPNTWAT